MDFLVLLYIGNRYCLESIGICGQLIGCPSKAICTWKVSGDVNDIHYICVHFCRFLADLMDHGDLIRNVAIVGHLHHGKVRMGVCWGRGRGGGAKGRFGWEGGRSKGKVWMGGREEQREGLHGRGKGKVWMGGREEQREGLDGREGGAKGRFGWEGGRGKGKVWMGGREGQREGLDGREGGAKGRFGWEGGRSKGKVWMGGREEKREGLHGRGKGKVWTMSVAIHCSSNYKVFLSL